MYRDFCFVSLVILYTVLTSCNGELLTTPSGNPYADKHILHLEETVSLLQSQFQAQEQKQAAVLSSLLSKLTSNTDELLNVKSDLESKHNSTLEELSVAVKEISNLKTEMKDLRNELATCKDSNLTLQEHQERKGGNSNIAFSSAITLDVTIKPGQTVIYPRVLVNNGNGHDNTTGIFTCPQNGTYMFLIHSMTTHSNRQFTLQLVYNDVISVSAFGRDGQGFMSSSNSAALNLRRGDEVSVKYDGTSYLRSKDGHLYTSFSGYFIASYDVQ